MTVQPKRKTLHHKSAKDIVCFSLNAHLFAGNLKKLVVYVQQQYITHGQGFALIGHNVATELGVTPHDAYKYINALVYSGLLEKEKFETSDGRSLSRFYLSEGGKA